MDKRDVLINKTGLKGYTCKCIHAKKKQKEDVMGQSVQHGASLNCLYPNAHIMGNEQEGLEVSVQLHLQSHWDDGDMVA